MKGHKCNCNSQNMNFGGFPSSVRKIGITISGLEQWKDGIVSGATVQVDVIQNGAIIHSEVFSGKASSPFKREVRVLAAAVTVDLLVVHNRPDLPDLQVSAEFINESQQFTVNNGQVFIKDSMIVCGPDNEVRMSIGVNSESEDEKQSRIASMVNEIIKARLKKELQPGGLLCKN